MNFVLFLKTVRDGQERVFESPIPRRLPTNVPVDGTEQSHCRRRLNTVHGLRGLPIILNKHTIILRMCVLFSREMQQRLEQVTDNT